MFIEGLDDSLMRQILTRRYVKGQTVRQTAAAVGYSVRQLIRIEEAFFQKLSPHVTACH